jgi:hypothetical protein
MSKCRYGELILACFFCFFVFFVFGRGDGGGAHPQNVISGFLSKVGMYNN